MSVLSRPVLVTLSALGLLWRPTLAQAQAQEEPAPTTLSTHFVQSQLRDYGAPLLPGVCALSESWPAAQQAGMPDDWYQDTPEVTVPRECLPQWRTVH